jgi:ABC-type multidrug transport system fused ATPase/permease subunit
MIARLQNLRRPSILQLLIFAALIQVVLTISVYAIGRLGILQGIDRDGCVIALSPDSATSLAQANSLSDLLIRSPLVWLGIPGNFHLKLYSLSLAILRPLFGVNILSVEPINLLCYISILWLAFKLGEEVFDRQAGLLATIAIALWPSFLLHTTQLLKDQIFIAVLLILVLIMACWLTRTFSWRLALLTGTAGAAAAYIVSLTRSGFWGAIVLAVALIGTGLLLIRQVRERRILIWNIFSAGLIVFATGTILFFAPENLQATPGFEVSPSGAVLPGGTELQDGRQSFSLIARADFFARRLSQLRQGFIDLNTNSGSDIDASVRFDTVVDVGRYLPRAVVIGFLAPFPNHWFEQGQVAGIAGRLLSGLEMCALYIVELLALICLWRSRSNLEAWLLFLVNLAGVVALALAVINLGALYRFRYGFFMLILILGAHGLMTLLGDWQQRKRKTDAARQHLAGEQTV